MLYGALLLKIWSRSMYNVEFSRDEDAAVLVPCEEASESDASLRYAVDDNVLVVMLPMPCAIAPS